jgi:hypothetical protein
MSAHPNMLTAGLHPDTKGVLNKLDSGSECAGRDDKMINPA